MKCPKCGYVSFEDVDVCKGCGRVMNDREAEGREEQENTFSFAEPRRQPSISRT